MIASQSHSLRGLAVAIDTHGCKLNQADSAAMARRFVEAGYRIAGPDEPADVYVLNSCTVTHVADRKARHALRMARRRNPSATVVATGITAEGNREVLGCDVGDSETEGFWQQFLGSLRERGPGGVRLVISDAHRGLAAAADRWFQGAARQRCRVHFIRNLLALVPKSHQHMAAAVFRTIFPNPTPAPSPALVQAAAVSAVTPSRAPHTSTLVRLRRRRGRLVLGNAAAGRRIDSPGGAMSYISLSPYEESPF